ncbi:hypothetical protein [Amycolatopsis echigonensis]|uniref:hypothetical protein n=1 Tax=Amycolatopsis echigonensis TaxID=2576905 RepID=UPI001FE963DB|nr:hypothetical protein [Amycolatopsis echigonensis]
MLDSNDDRSGVDFTFLRRPEGHEIGSILGDPPARRRRGAPCSSSRTQRDRAVEHGGEVVEAQDSPCGRTVTVHGPFGAQFLVGS